jgi:hypothetical protein
MVSYNWAITGGAVITSGDGTNAIVVDFSCFDRTVSSCTLRVTGSNSCGVITVPSQVIISVTGAVATIGGSGTVTRDSSAVTYTVSPTYAASDTMCRWSVTGGATITGASSGDDLYSVVVNFNYFARTASMNVCTLRFVSLCLCGDSIVVTRTVTVNQAGKTYS